MVPGLDIRAGAWKNKIKGALQSGGKVTHECSNCGTLVKPVICTHHYKESGLPNVYLQGVEVADCAACGNTDITIPHPRKVHRAITLAIAKSPARLTGRELRFLRTHLGYSGDQLAAYLHTDKTKISKWEKGEDRIGPSNDRLIRLLVAALDQDLVENIPVIAAHLLNITDDPKQNWTLNIDVENLTYSYQPLRSAA